MNLYTQYSGNNNTLARHYFLFVLSVEDVDKVVKLTLFIQNEMNKINSKSEVIFGNFLPNNSQGDSN